MPPRPAPRCCTCTPAIPRTDGRRPILQVFRSSCRASKRAATAVINITTGGSVLMTLEDRMAAADHVLARNVLVQHGLDELRALSDGGALSRNGSTTGRSRICSTPTRISSATRFATSSGSPSSSAKAHGVKFEHECYDTGHLYNLAHCVDRGLFKPPIFLQLIYGILGGIGPDIDNLLFMKRTADRLFGDQYLWSVLAGGRHQIPFATTATMIGGNVRVGLEDSLYIGRGKLAASNAEQVTKIRRIIEELGYEAATPKEARAMLGLKGADRVKF